MAYRDFDDSPLMRLLRFVSRSFRIGNFFGVELYMYWAAAVLMPLLFLRWIGPFSSGPVEALFLSLTFAALLFAIIWTHEMGHILMGRRYGIHTHLITLSPIGGVAHMNAPATNPRMETAISLAGPAVHLAWLAVCWPLWMLLPASFGQISGWSYSPIEMTLWFLVTTNTSLLLFNLLPVWALDGGRVLRALLAMRLHPNRATLWATNVGFVGGGLMILYGLVGERLEGTVLVVIGLSCLQACVNERRLAKHVLVYQQHGGDAWASDPDAWKRGRRGDGRDPGQPGMFARWRAERQRRKAARLAAEQAALNAEVDAILERVHKVGIGGIDARERAILERASKKRRNTG